ncbi:DUF6456 domain-containing protein [uncultured Maritimibacter sp.]|jgi:lambda repressor-like predicted transcriptional regulator|uniref:DUF6456 domain-containing protein n=1 Tax=uncultured Maritimibacter sp. TaxID=991866 RepID=UPI0026211280|nr:DUF6456 domain-containing protein [uncultured Maritimibacter sp.]
MPKDVEIDVAGASTLADWVPPRVIAYLEHTEAGTSLRPTAAQEGCHASTVLRQVRRAGALRDEPLAARAIHALGASLRNRTQTGRPSAQTEAPAMSQTAHAFLTDDIDHATLDRDILRALRALADPGALLVIAEGVEDAVVVGKGAYDDDRPVRKAVVTRQVAEQMAVNEWIAGDVSGRLSRYRITTPGRAEFQRRLAGAESRRLGAQELMRGGEPKEIRKTKLRSAGSEAPLRVLARRKRSGGDPFLTQAMTRAAERFRESYEIARAGGAIGDDLGRLLTGAYPVDTGRSEGNLVRQKARHVVAHESLDRALRALGPELAETVLLSCCLEDGMETIEAKLDYPARSGKIVLRIALGALERHYDRVGDEGQDLIY